MKGYALFYKDKDGFETPLTEFGVIEVHPNKSSIAKFECDILDKIDDLLERKKIITKTKKFMFFTTTVETYPEPLKQHQIELYTRIKNTLFIREVAIV